MLDEKIRELIKESLPEQAAKEMREYIAKAEVWKEDLDDTENALKMAKERIKELEDEDNKKLNIITELQGSIEYWQKREDELLQREKEVQDRANILDVVTANERQKNAEKSLETVTDLVKTIFRNPIVKKTVIENKTEPVVTKRTEMVCDQTTDYQSRPQEREVADTINTSSSKTTTEETE